ncbi:hypothetical protein GY21_10170 [Cryobacterium roopkundense]|uniref:Mutator family transposase n=1 Tax=Cryobacterium roopkundense TaxID=1001240 RepID=A0A099J9W8_9MICO|nr:hypothetical protein GY21_10170 [Cryobacterium roopkundense]MBB5640609.1 transposase-like protein [Cryobacterium roopkundense]
MTPKARLRVVSDNSPGERLADVIETMVFQRQCVDGFIASQGARGFSALTIDNGTWAHTGLKKAIGTVFQGAGWQRCRVHVMRNVLAMVPKGSQEMVASIIRTIFARPDREHIEKQFREVAMMLGRSYPKVAAMLTDAQPDLLAFAAFPRRHWRQIWSTNPLSVYRLSNDTSLSALRMMRAPRSLGWKLLQTGRQIVS